ncbi:zinc ribbon domain-containing protein [Staphylococcus croceilyticus]|uniref:Zinc ribbon domain-containing protein n=2 Tax=Staphylococcus croceilyticus TaxID=319942 RepID=A0ABY2KEX1_9STAP|nr:zinc ribbon domain-containing protein [Staphylococcus croceilyticus]
MIIKFIKPIGVILLRLALFLYFIFQENKYRKFQKSHLKLSVNTTCVYIKNRKTLFHTHHCYYTHQEVKGRSFMKYCPQCGSPINANQRFCNKCGYDLKAFEQYRDSGIYFQPQPPEPPQQKRKVWPWVVIGALIIAIIIASCLTYYFFFIKDEQHTSNEATTTQHTSKTEKQKNEHKASNDAKKSEKHETEKENKVKSPKIDVMSEDFERTYMQSNNLGGYMGVRKGMTRSEVEKLVGKSTGTLKVDGFKWESTKYGNLTVDYDSKGEDGKVIAVGVSPDHVSTSEFLDRYPSYDDYSGSEIVYNNFKGNGYLVAVDIDHGYIAKIQCLAE